MKHYYAQQSPRGSSNEINTYRFTSKAERNAWVSEHKNDGGLNSAYCGAKPITSRQAQANVQYKGDTITDSFNRFYPEN